MNPTRTIQGAMMAALLSLTAHEASARNITINITNTDTIQRQEVVEIPLSKIEAAMGDDAKRPFRLLNIRGQEVDYQITYDRMLLVDASVSPLATMTLTTASGQPRQPKTFVTGKRYYQRKDDLAWENDRGIYRIYGPALQKTGERSFGTDIWVKNVPDLVMESRYQLDEWGNAVGDAMERAGEKALADSVDLVTTFHLDHGNGMDGYSVGATLGCGTPGIINGKTFIMPYCYTECEVLDNGPLRFTAKVKYGENELGMTEHRIISLDKGSHFNRWTVWHENVKRPVTFCAGVVMNGKGQLVKGKNYVAYADPTDAPKLHNSQIYVAALFPYNDVTTTMTPDNRNAVGTIKGYKGEKITYYAGHAWSRYDIRSFAQWQLEIKEFMQARQHEMTVSIGNEK